MTKPKTANQSADSLIDGQVDGLADYLESSLQEYFQAHGGVLPPSGLYERIIKEIEKPLLRISLDAVNGNQLKAASLLGLNRNTLRKKLRDHKMDRFVRNIRPARRRGVKS